MATITVPVEPTAPTRELEERLERTWETPRGLLGQLMSVDHKTIGKRYLVTSFAFLVLGGLEALALRTQLAHSDLRLLAPETYNQLFTMHGLTMLFWFAAPVLSGFSNYLWPLMIGSRDMAFPRLNALSYWIFLASGIFIYSSFLVGQAPDGGWFGYVPLTDHAFSPGVNLDYYALGLIFVGLSSTVGAINFIVTFFELRCPGMSVNRLPILLWGTLSTSFAILFAIPALTVACIFLYFDRRFGMHFYTPGTGGHPLLWQHLFWMFGHPWVYIIVLPAMGIASDIIPTFCRRPLVGYTFVALATVATAMLGFGVWVHHMFATGLPQLSMTYFSAASMLISIPSGVAVFSWIATFWTGRPVFKTPLLFMAGFVVLFVIGGVSGVVTAVVPFDWQVTDTYFVVAHLHYVLIGINVFPVIAGIYYWFPKITGRMMDERLGKLSFWLLFSGALVGFFPMHIVGLLGMPRRIYTYPGHLGWDAWNLLETIGVYVFALGAIVFIVNAIRSWRRGVIAGANPWDAPTLEWSTPSPPPPYNFAVIPTVHSRHPLWEGRLREEVEESSLGRGLALDGDARRTVATTPLDSEPYGVFQMPQDSIWPLAVAASLLMVFFGLLGHRSAPLAIVGALLLLISAIGWMWPTTTTPNPAELRP